MNRALFGSRGRTENRGATLPLATTLFLPALRLAALFLSSVILAGCVSPMGQREAESRASQSLRSFCRDKTCGPTRLLKTAKLKNRWLVDFDGPGSLYTVAVDAGGSTNVSVWNKNSPR